MSESPRDLVRDLLESFAEKTGDNSYRRAASALNWATPGRRPKYPQRPDQLAIDEARDLLANGKAGSIHGALMQVAKARWPYAKPRSVAQRLTRKIKRDHLPIRCEDESDGR
jgi:hypothetical protein